MSYFRLKKTIPHQILHILIDSNQFFNKILCFFTCFSKIHNFSKSISLLNIFFFDPGQDLPKGFWSRDPFQQPYIVFRIFPRLNFEIAARGRTGGLPDLPISRILSVFFKLIFYLYKSIFGGHSQTQRWKSVWKLGLRPQKTLLNGQWFKITDFFSKILGFRNWRFFSDTVFHGQPAGRLAGWPASRRSRLLQALSSSVSSS